MSIEQIRSAKTGAVIAIELAGKRDIAADGEHKTAVLASNEEGNLAPAGTTATSTHKKHATAINSMLAEVAGVLNRCKRFRIVVEGEIDTSVIVVKPKENAKVEKFAGVEVDTESDFSFGDNEEAVKVLKSASGAGG